MLVHHFIVLLINFNQNCVFLILMECWSHNCVLVIRRSPWKLQDYRPKNSGEVVMKKIYQGILTFKNHASYIQDGRTTTLQMLHFIYIFSTNISTEYFKQAAHSLFFSSECPLFHNVIFFGSCIICILPRGVLKFKWENRVPKD
jgi:hypothetical protein